MASGGVTHHAAQRTLPASRPHVLVLVPLPARGRSAVPSADLADTTHHYATYPCTFLPCRTLGGHGRRPSDTVRPLTGARPVSSTPSTPHLIRRKALRTQQSSPRHRLEPQSKDTPIAMLHSARW